MASKIPLRGRISWLALIPQVLILFGIGAGYYFLWPKELYFKTFGTYFVIALLLGNLVPFYHRKAIRLVKKNKWEEAIPCFQLSYKFFKKHQWVDRFKCVTVMSSSIASYKEMALVNEAFCLSQIDKKQESIYKYEEALKEFPESGIAFAALKLLK